MTRDGLLSALSAAAETDPRFLALLLGGSLGRGEGDEWSDLDLIAVVAPEHHAAVNDGVSAWIEGVAGPLVHAFRPVPGAPLFSGVTADWLRVDVTVTVPSFVRSARDRVVPLFDRAGVVAALPATLPPGAIDASRIEALTLEFIRVLGLLPVGLGRQEYAVIATGVGLQRAALIALMIEAAALPQPPGALSLSRVLSPADLAVIDALPPPGPTRESALAANAALAHAFIPRARALLERGGGAWPEAFWAATQKHLDRALGPDWSSPLTSLEDEVAGSGSD